MSAGGSSDSIADALQSLSDHDRREKGDAAEPAGPSGEAAPRQPEETAEEAPPEQLCLPQATSEAEDIVDGAEGNPLQAAAGEPIAQDVAGPAGRASDRLARSDSDDLRKLGVLLLLGLGALLLIPALWAAGWLVGLQVPGAQRESAGAMAMLMLSAWPIALLLFAAAGLTFRQIRNQHREQDQGQAEAETETEGE